jgi:hypothetical protein
VNLIQIVPVAYLRREARAGGESKGKSDRTVEFLHLRLFSKFEFVPGDRPATTLQEHAIWTEVSFLGYSSTIDRVSQPIFPSNECCSQSSR